MPSAHAGWDAPVRRPRPTLVRVRGRSMLPTYRDGDVLLAVRGIPARPGRAAVVRLPRDRDGAPRPLSVKRVTGRDPDDATRWWIESDNPREGVSGFDVGGLRDVDVLAVVVTRLPRTPRWVRTLMSRRPKQG